MQWYAAHTHARDEVKAMLHLRRQGFEVYLPQHLKRRRHARRTDWVPSPLFPRYLFVRMDPEGVRWRAINSTIGVSYLVCNGDRPSPVPPGIVEEIFARTDDDGMVQVSRKSAHRGYAGADHGRHLLRPCRPVRVRRRQREGLHSARAHGPAGEGPYSRRGGFSDGVDDSGRAFWTGGPGEAFSPGLR